MSAFVSYTSYDYAPVSIVPVIASFDSEGHIKPLYVRICGEPYKIHSSWLKQSFADIFEFHCKVMDDDCLKPLVLTYHTRENVWTIPK